MTRKLKVLGMALMAVLALSAVSASASSAAVEFHSEEKDLTLTGTQTTTNKFITDAGEVTCVKAIFSGTTSTTATTQAEQTVTPKYEECHAIFFGSKVTVTVDMNTCDYDLRAIGTAAITCTKVGDAIAVTAPGCTTTISPSGNNTLSKVTYTNGGAGTTRDITVTNEITNIDYVEDPVGFIPTCASPNTTTTNGKYEGSVTVTGKNSAGVQKGIWVA
jgi:hypothetical protein